MSQSNRDGKKTARERVAAERLRQQKAARRRKQYTISGVTIAVIAIAGGTGLAISLHKDKPLVSPVGAVVDPLTKSNSLLGIHVGSADAPVKMTVFEDFRCPVCKEAEGAVESTYRQYVADGKVQITYHPVTLIDGNSGGNGSLYAGNAAACAQDAGQFMPLHDLLYANQPDEKTDGYGSRANLVSLAGQIPALKSDPTFLGCVTNGNHDGWVEANENAFNAIGAKGTPTLYIGSTVFNLPDTSTMTSADQLNQAWSAAMKAEFDKQFAAAGGKAGTPYTFPADAPTTPAASGTPSAGATPSAGGTPSAPAGSTSATTPPSSSATTTKS